MKGWATLCVSILVGLVCISFAQAGEKAPQKITDMAGKELAAFGSNPVLVKAVTDQNAKGATLDEIKTKDDAWMKTAGIDASMKALMENPCAAELRKIVASAPHYAEIFVMDDKGANVCMTEKTSDYWQGDEDKFKKSFADGKGAVFVDEVNFDKSTQTYLVQVSVPVMADGKAIGAITFGIDVDKVK